MSSTTTKAQPPRPPAEMRFEIRANAEVIEALRIIAARNDRSTAGEVRRALAAHVRRENAAE